MNEVQQKRRNKSAKVFRSLYHQCTYVGERRHKNGFIIIEKKKTTIKEKSTYIVGKPPGVKKVTFGCRGPSEM